MELQPIPKVNSPTESCQSCSYRMKEDKQDKEYTYVTLEFRVPKKSNTVASLVKDYMIINPDNNAELLNLRINENRW